MISISRFSVKIIFAFLLVNVSFFNKIFSQTDIDTKEFTQELQRFENSKERIELIWWIPYEYWENVIKSQGEEEEVKEFLDVLSKYEIFGVLTGQLGVVGKVNSPEYSEIVKMLKVYDLNGIEMKSLSNENTDEKVQLLLDVFKPMFKNMLGSLGENLHFIVFDARQGNKRKLNPTERGEFKVMMEDREYKWKLPLASLLPPQYCPECKTKMKGNWVYCPFHGIKLESTLKK